MLQKARLTLLGLLALAAVSAVATPINAQAKDPEKTTYTKATFDSYMLRKNLAGPELSMSNESVEKITFKVKVDEEGDIQSLTYSHNVTSISDEAVQRYIKNAYKAIMNTDFDAATKDGKPIADQLTINFEVVG